MLNIKQTQSFIETQNVVQTSDLSVTCLDGLVFNFLNVFQAKGTYALAYMFVDLCSYACITLPLYAIGDIRKPLKCRLGT